MDDLRDIHEHDQLAAMRRAFAVALARDVTAYRDALSGAGISAGLLDTMTRDFAARWVKAATPSVDLVSVWEDDA